MTMTAAEKIIRKMLVPSILDTNGWADVPAQLRDRAFFSATVTESKFLERAREVCARIANGEMSRSEARRDLRSVLNEIGYNPEGEVGLKNLMSKRRLDLIIDTNKRQARGWRQRLEAVKPGALIAYPAQELVRARQRRIPRNWTVRWNEAARAVGWEGVCRDEFRHVALKTSPIWTKISRFGTPYPPFDFNSGMGVRDVSASECRRIGLDYGGQKAGAEKFNDSIETSSGGVAADSPLGKAMLARFGGRVEIVGGVIKWKEQA